MSTVKRFVAVSLAALALSALHAEPRCPGNVAGMALRPIQDDLIVDNEGEENARDAAFYLGQPGKRDSSDNGGRECMTGQRRSRMQRLVRADMFWPELVRGTTKVLCEALDGANVGTNSTRGLVATLQFLKHDLA